MWLNAIDQNSVTGSLRSDNFNYPLEDGSTLTLSLQVFFLPYTTFHCAYN